MPDSRPENGGVCEAVQGLGEPSAPRSPSVARLRVGPYGLGLSCEMRGKFDNEVIPQLHIACWCARRVAARDETRAARGQYCKPSGVTSERRAT